MPHEWELAQEELVVAYCMEAATKKSCVNLEELEWFFRAAFGADADDLTGAAIRSHFNIIVRRCSPDALAALRKAALASAAASKRIE